MKHVLIVGVSTRAAAESAARAGFEVTTIDAFADLDQDPRVRVLSLDRKPHPPFTAAAVARAAESIDCDAVAYLSNLENHPSVVAALAVGRRLWGNPPDVLRRVRDPWLLARVLHKRGIPAPAVRCLRGNAAETAVPGETKEHSHTEIEKLTSSGVGGWLVKPLASGGGHDVRRWQPSTAANRPLPRRSYLQELVEGTPGSLLFVAAGGCAVPLGISRQLIGEPAFGAKDYQYCGNILASEDDPQFVHDQMLTERACTMASVLAEEFDLVGANGIDFIARDGVPYPIEVNPRWSASMELAERAYDRSCFEVHAAACSTGALPPFDLMKARRRGGAIGKAVIFARHDVVIGDTRAWLGDATVRDVPHPGERILAGRPVCTVFANGPDSLDCYSALVARAQSVYSELQ